MHRPRPTSSWHAILAALTLGALPACGGGAGGGVSSDRSADTGVEPDTGGVASDAESDAAAGDVGAAGDAGGDEAADAVPGDGAGPEAGPDSGTACPGGPGCPCEDNTGCDAGFCIPFAAGKRCAAKCVDTCAEGLRCASVDGGGGDIAQICVPVLEWLCDPCTGSESCRGVGLADAHCVDYGNAGAFCGAPCGQDGDCPVGTACEQVQSIEGKPVKQCVKKAEDGGAGLCECSEAARDKGLTTSCQIVHKEPGGGLTAKCPGQRTCTAKGLSACVGPAPEAETCDGADNDCDGKTDEGTCDDDNACTLDLCDQAAEPVGCAHKKLDGQACDADGNACTESDACESGLCVPGKPRSCDDGNGCTLDACLPAAGCTNTDDDGKGCEADGNPCTVGDSCTDGVCAAGKIRACDSGQVCTIGKCDPGSGKCVFADASKLCDDGDPCTIQDACDQGFCKGTVHDCDDGSPCTADSCAKPSGCAHKPVAVACNDGDACTAGDFCKGGHCIGQPVACDDGNACTKDGCDPSAKGAGKLGACTHAPLSNTPCDDGDPCTVPDVCQAGKCGSGPAKCGQCNRDSDCAARDDGNPCNGVLFCDLSKLPSVCRLNPATVVVCPLPADPTCTTSGCRPGTGKCVTEPRPDGRLCDADGSVCTQNDACKAGKCTEGPALPCDDGNACTSDACDPAKGCHHSELSGPCDDGNACTSGDRCARVGGVRVCKPGAAVKCDDGNPCTVESCAVDKGCVQVVDVSIQRPCYSGKAGTRGVGTCVGGFERCRKDGSFGPCQGEVLPAAREACDGRDDDCDGKTDVGCKAEGFVFEVVGAAVQGGGQGGGQGGATGLRVRSGGPAGGGAGAQTGARLGWLRWLGRLTK